MVRHQRNAAASLTPLEQRLEELAAKGSIKKGTGTLPDELIFETPPSLPDPYGLLAQLLEDRERGW